MKKKSLSIHNSSEGTVCRYGGPFTTLLHLKESHDSGDAKKKKMLETCFAVKS